MMEPSTDGSTPPPGSTRAFFICVSVAASCSTKMPWAFSTFTSGAILPSTLGNWTTSPMRSWAMTPSTPSRPCSVNAPDSAALTGPSKASLMAWSPIAGSISRGSTSTPSGLSQPVVTRSNSSVLSTSWPGTGSVTFASPPSMAIAPSAGSRCNSPATRSSCGVRAASFTVDTMSTSRVRNNPARRVNGFADSSPALATVASQSMPRPDSAGTSCELCDAAFTVTGLLAVSPSSASSFAVASSWLMPPISTPPTAVPRGTFPRFIARSAR